MANDFGTVINPMIVAGQAHGGVLQGIGQALMERTEVDASGQLQTGSFQDYCLPRAADAPPFVIEDHPTIATTNPLGVKGCGEAGCAGSLPSVMNALVDALASRGVTHINMPATPERIWRMANNHRSTRPLHSMYAPAPLENRAVKSESDIDEAACEIRARSAAGEP
jgi:carbon-monoxide dehydrogenase large subunit